ncbi:MAG: orotidine-5'-phosphate decarboxylase [Thermoguttaceae bacterium]|nr:orotidine-5'-phosphate decarboxylase [Thermoguttaceae bacterium]MDW8077512.1 orotidine-5'-phosphate decarboxylase [Thermoguttaceae bacterium]
MTSPGSGYRSPHFGEKLALAVKAKRTPAVVGLDPRWRELPDELRSQAGHDSRESQAEAVCRFCEAVVDQVAELVPAVKVQSAFFESLGPEGMGSLARVIGYARQRGLLVIVDAKRGDIGSTAEAYAKAYFAPDQTAPWPADAITVNPYLGTDALQPFLEAARAAEGGVFVLVRTSNPGAPEFQDLTTVAGKPVYRHIAEWVETQAAATAGHSGLGMVGAVVGATYPAQLEELRGVMPHAWLLVPGYGAQGATAKEVVPAFRSDGLGAIVNSSRGIIFAFRRPEYQSLSSQRGWQAAVRKATEDMIAELREHTPAGRL